MKKLHTAAEIAAMNIPGLPSTKPGILNRAEKEKWHYETKIGLGGVRKMFEIPVYYLPGYKPYANAPVVTAPKANTPTTDAIIESAGHAPESAKGEVIGAISNGAKIDPAVLEQVVATLDRWLLAKGLTLAPDKYAALVAVLYDYIAKGANSEDLARFLKAVA